MRRIALILTTLLPALASFPLSAAAPVPDIAAVARPFVENLKQPEFSQSRCLLAPLLAEDRRTIVMSRGDNFRPRDRILAINGESLSDTGSRPLHEILIRYPPGATLTVRVLRAGSETDVTAACLDSAAHFALLRAAVTAASQGDAAICADAMGNAGKQHALAATWLNLALACNVKAGRVEGAPMLAEFFMVFHVELLANQYSPEALQKVRASMQAGAQKLLDAGSPPLAEKLQQEYADAVAKWPRYPGSALGLELLTPPVASANAGRIQQPPQVSVTQNGNVTQMNMVGQLAAKHPVVCVPLADVDNTRTPPDLYRGVSACLEHDNYRAAAALFALAGMESRFDAERVLDKTAGQAGQVLIMNTFNGLPDEKRQQFKKVVGELAADPAAIAQLCASIRTIGSPNYYPEYMVLHGIRAFTAKPGDSTLEPTFDAAVTWNSLLTNYLNCHDVPGAPASIAKAQPASPANEDARSNDPTRMKPGVYQVKTTGGPAESAQRNEGPTFMRMCFTQAMIDATSPGPQQGHCDDVQVRHDGNKTHTGFSCTVDGKTTTGRSDETVNGNTRTSVIEFTMSDKDGAHPVRLETEMTFLGPDCNVAYPAPPIPIEVRHYRYEVSVVADRHTYHWQSEYQCRLEGDASAGFTRLEWRLNGGLNQLRITGALPDGSQFKVLPLHLDWRLWDKNSGQCSAATKPVDSEIWLRPAADPSREEQFDRHHDRSDRHELRLIDSQLVLFKTDSAAPGEAIPQPRPYVEDGPRYYQVKMTTVPAASVSDQKGLKEFTQQKRIPWITKGGIYPFTAWSNDDVTFARNYTAIFTTEDDRRGGPGKDAEGLATTDALPAHSEWLIDRDHHNRASQWLRMPDRTDADKDVPPPDPAAMTKTWIVYNGARIEIALFNFYRVLYDPVRDEYVLFSINRVDAD